jgi:hypothetical protein
MSHGGWVSCGNVDDGGRRLGFDTLNQRRLGFDTLNQRRLGFDTLNQRRLGFDKLNQRGSGFDRLNQRGTQKAPRDRACAGSRGASSWDAGATWP